MKITTEQKRAIKQIFDRHPIVVDGRAITYREFRRTVVYGYDCLMVDWSGMWLGIEADGYTHS